MTSVELAPAEAAAEDARRRTVSPAVLLRPYTTRASTCASLEFGSCSDTAPVLPGVTVETVVDSFDSWPVPRCLYVKLNSYSMAEDSEPLPTVDTVLVRSEERRVGKEWR